MSMKPLFKVDHGVEGDPREVPIEELGFIRWLKERGSTGRFVDDFTAWLSLQGWDKEKHRVSPEDMNLARLAYQHRGWRRARGLKD